VIIREWRYFPGPNVHCHRPVMELIVDLEDLAHKTTRDLPHFNPALLAAFPGLREHYCGLGFPGGFALRLSEGTYFGHVAEHVALELLDRHGHPVVYGKTRSVGGGCYMVVFEAPLAELGLEAARTALAVVTALAKDGANDVARAVQAFRQKAAEVRLGPSTEAIVRAAERRNIPVRRLGPNSFVQLGWGVFTRRVEATLSSLSSAVAVDIACDKELTKTVLRMAGLPVPRGGVAQTREEALEIAARIGWPVVLKPVCGNQGRGVVTGVRSRRDLFQAFATAAAHGRPVVVEEEIPGRQYRLLVVGDEVVAAAERMPPTVVGDGVHTVAELVAIENADPRRGEGHERPLTRIVIDGTARRQLRRQGLTPDSVPPAGAVVLLRDSANLSTGGVATDVTDSVSPALRSLARRAAQAVGLDIAGVDILAPDPSAAHGVVIEVNACPGIRMHEHPWRGRSQAAGEAIVRHLFPFGDGRIPVVAVTGTNGKSTTVRLVAHLLRRSGRLVGMTTTDGVFVGDEEVLHGDCAGPRSAEVVLYDPRVEAAVLECARGGLRRGGLAFDRADVGILLNISDDHLGQDGIETLEDLLHVKSLVVEAVRPDGYAVLNADDPWVLQARHACRSGVILFSQNADNLAVKKWLQQGGTAVFVRNGRMMLGRRAVEEEICRVAELPFTLGGRATCMVENALAAAAAGIALGLPRSEVAAGLRSFQGGDRQNPGRLNLYEVGDVRILVDYGHNPAALEAVVRTARALSPRRLVGVVGMPGDRRDEDAIRFGVIAGRGFDRLYVKEDKDLRGRRPGELAELIARGARSTGQSVEIVLDEPAALRRALDEADAGDLVVVLYEKLEPLLSVIADARRQHSPVAVGALTT
jgi:cyanophycin synthetase